MTREEALYCMKSNSVLHSETCEECPLYGDTGVDHCFEDALDEVIKALEQEPCEDTISRQWLIECVNEGWIKFDTEKDENRFIHLVRDIAPPVNPQVKTGYWITEIKSDIESELPINPMCSECGGEPYYSNSIYDYKFCPYCGAKMVKARQFAELVAAEISDKCELVKPQESEAKE